MTAHIVVPALDDAPATVSPDPRRAAARELGFDGLVMTDALEMRGLRETVGVEEGAVRALAAGADALCLGHDLGVESVEASTRRSSRPSQDGRLETERLEQAAERVARIGTRGAGTATAPDRGVGLEAARRAAARERRSRRSRACRFVVELWPDPSIAAGPAGVGLGELLAERLPGTARVELVGPPADGADLLDAARRADRQLVLVLRDAHRHAWERETTQRLLAEAPGAVVVELGLPLWRPAGAAGYVAAHGAGRANRHRGGRSTRGAVRLNPRRPAPRALAPCSPVELEQQAPDRGDARRCGEEATRRVTFAAFCADPLAGTPLSTLTP